MKVFALGFVFASSVALLHGASIVTCSNGLGDTQTVYNGTCVIGSGDNTLSYFGSSGGGIAGNQLSVAASAYLIYGPLTTGPSAPPYDPAVYPLTATASWSDSFAIPQSNPNDILKISVYGYGLGHQAYIQVGDIDYTTQDFCDAHVDYDQCLAAGEAVEKVESASQAPFVEVFGTDSIGFTQPCYDGQCGVSANAGLYESVTIDRYLPDGVTPDPFTTTPEPSTIGLIGLASFLLAACRYRRARVFASPTAIHRCEGN